jgi:outer membrane protein assembly factor BamD (BamD/ComL family)
VKKLLMLGIVVTAMIFFASCATAPKKGPEPEERAASKAPESDYREAKELRAKISQFGLARYAQDDYDKAEESFKTGESLYNKDNEKSQAALKVAIRGYKSVIEKGFPAYLDDKIYVVERIKKEAEDLKAPVAVKDEYKSAKAVYDDALKSKNKGDYENASGLLDEAKDQFQSVYDVTLAKKEKAEQNLAEANAMIEELEAAAAQE